MRIACLSVHSSPLGKVGTKDTGGMSIYLRELAYALGDRDISVDIFTRARAGEKDLVLEICHGARVIHLDAGPKDVGKLELYAHLEEFTANLENFRKSESLHYDIIFSHYWLSGCVGLELQRAWDTPHMLMYHTLGAVKNAACPGENEPHLRIAAEKTLAKECSLIITASEREKEELMIRYGASGDKIAVIPCGVNLDIFQPTASDNAKEKIGFPGGYLILFVGRMEPVKGLDLLISALSKLPEELNYRLLVIGGDEAGASAVGEHQKLARRLGVEEKIYFCGTVKHDALPLYYSAADLLTIPSYYESFGLTALEALACGTPVVATDVGDLNKIICPGETGWIVENRDPEELASRIAYFLERDRPKPTTACRNSVAAYGWPIIAEQLIKTAQREGSFVSLL